MAVARDFKRAAVAYYAARMGDQRVPLEAAMDRQAKRFNAMCWEHGLDASAGQALLDSIPLEHL